MPDPKLSLIVPVYFEEECVQQFILETTAVLEGESIDYEIIFIDDGSLDKTVELIKAAIAGNPRLRLIELSYNHGKQAALTAGLTYARGELHLMMDPDLQDPPEEIPRFIAEISRGFDIVFGVRQAKKDSLVNVLFSRLFWWTLEKFTALDIPRGLAVMRIFNRKFTSQFLKYREQNRFIEGIFMHIGMRRSTLTIPQRRRFAGITKFTPRRKFALALNAVLDFSELPLRFTVRLGLALMMVSLVSAVGIMVARVFFMTFQLGWPSLFVMLLFGFGLQLFFMGIIGQYVARVYMETKQRPLFSVRTLTNIFE